MLKPAVFLDRDGVINVDRGNYVYEINDFTWIEGAKQAVKLVKENNFIVIVITNQAGVAHGYYKESDINKIHKFINSELKKINTYIDDFFYCPHHPLGSIPKYTKNCNCRKPNSGMLKNATAKWEIDLNNSFLVGDKKTDIEAAHNHNVEGFMFSGKNLYYFIEKILKNKGII